MCPVRFGPILCLSEEGSHWNPKRYCTQGAWHGNSGDYPTPRSWICSVTKEMKQNIQHETRRKKKSQSCLTIQGFTLFVRFSWVYLNVSKTVDPNPKALHFQRHPHFQPNSDGFGRRCPVWTWPCLPVWEFYGIRGLYFVPWYLWSCFLEKKHPAMKRGHL